ncbi:lipoprotein [Actinobacillus minor 202]|uniref:Lipoprotein n=1 Tax=Actinobacillus minor 202 TaxID=591023 RepID=A0ABP2GUT9_9PAST|nr:Bor family protein [Actinobacillus minor]EEV24828.1 lipoprotein [Actinobacillus minor 202]
MKKFLTTLLAASCLLSGCATQTAYINDSSSGKLSYEDNQSFFLFGIGQENTVNAVQICSGESKIAKVESELTGKNILLGLVTLGIYTPRAARVYCL